MREESYHFLEKKNYFKKIYLDEVLFSRYSSKFPNPISKYPLNRKHERILCHAISRLPNFLSLKGNDYYNPNTVVASTTI